MAGSGPERVVLHDGAVIPAHTLLVGRGKGCAISRHFRHTSQKRWRILVESDLTLPGHSDVYVIGDMVYLKQDGSALPMIAPVVMQMGIYVGRVPENRLFNRQPVGKPSKESIQIVTVSGKKGPG